MVGEKGLIEKYGFELDELDIETREEYYKLGAEIEDNIILKSIINFWSDSYNSGEGYLFSDETKVYTSSEKDLASKKKILDILANVDGYDKYFDESNVLAGNEKMVVFTDGLIVIDYDKFIPIVFSNMKQINIKYSSIVDYLYESILIEDKDGDIKEIGGVSFVSNIDLIMIHLFILSYEKKTYEIKNIILNRFTEEYISYSYEKRIVSVEELFIRFEYKNIFSGFFKNVIIDNYNISINNNNYDLESFKRFWRYSDERIFRKRTTTVYLETKDGDHITVYDETGHNIIDPCETDIISLNNIVNYMIALNKLRENLQNNK